MSRKREHGRIISVETHTRGDALAEDAAAGATSITVEDAGDFDEDGGWLTTGGQVIEFSECDDDTGVILLVDPLAAAAEQGDPVHVWSDLYAEVVEYQEALVELDGEYDNPDPVVAEVAEGVGDLPEGDRGKAGESCTLLRIADDEWEVVGVGGRSRKSKSIRFESDDAHVITAADIAAEVVTVPLSHRPIDESLTAYWGGVSQSPSEYAVDYDARTVTWPLAGFERVGDRLWVHYAYRKGFAGWSGTILDWQSSGWKHLEVAQGDTVDRSTPGFDDSAWSIGPAAFGDGGPSGDGSGHPAGFPTPTTTWTIHTAIWLRRTLTIPAGVSSITVDVRADLDAEVYVDGVNVPLAPGGTGTFTASGTIAVSAGDVVLAARFEDDNAPDPGNFSYADVKVTA